MYLLKLLNKYAYLLKIVHNVKIVNVSTLVISAGLNCNSIALKHVVMCWTQLLCCNKIYGEVDIVCYLYNERLWENSIGIECHQQPQHVPCQIVANNLKILHWSSTKGNDSWLQENMLTKLFYQQLIKTSVETFICNHVLFPFVEHQSYFEFVCFYVCTQQQPG